MTKKLKDDFYDYINDSWLKEAKIPCDRDSISAFVEIDLKLEELLKGLLKEWSLDETKIPNIPEMKEMTKFYKLIVNKEKRKELGWEPVRKFLDKLNTIKSFDEIYSATREFWLDYSYLPINVELQEDFVDNEKRIVWLDSVSTILPSKELYEKEEEKTKLLKTWEKMIFDLLIDYGFENEVAQKMTKNAIEFDDLYKNYILSSVQMADYVSLYNLKQRNELDSYTSFDLKSLLDKIVNQEVTEASMINVTLFEKFDEIFNEKNFEKYKSMLFINNLLKAAQYLSEDIRIKAGEFSRAVYSVADIRKLEDFAFDLSTAYFGMPLGMFYAHKYFGEEAKKDVESMVKNMIQVYKEKLEANTWLSKETIEKAIIKLNSFEYMVGYPEIIEPYYSQFKVKTYEEGSNIFENIHGFKKLMLDYSFSLYHKSMDKRLWGMSPAMVNAYYHPMKNHIVFPAAILSWPFYDIKRSRSANYGGIGAVIAHEISHGFDNNGSQFDKKGKLNNWWTDHDREEFLKRTQAVIDLYEGQKTEFGLVNGKLTVSENIADLGGFDCALEAAQREDEFNPKELFENWAVSWRIIMKEGSAKRRLESDVHAPGKIRTNVILGNNELFLKTYDINEGDGMFIPVKKRVKIW